MLTVRRLSLGAGFEYLMASIAVGDGGAELGTPLASYYEASGTPPVVAWNRARSLSDGRWRTLDSRGLYKQVVTLSEIYDGVLEDLLTAELGVEWRRSETHGGQVKVEIEGVKDDVWAEFSQRRREIDATEEQLVGVFSGEHGRGPSPVERRRIAQQANLATRRQKTHRSLARAVRSVAPARPPATSATAKHGSSR